jgi:hypothetical protein
MNKTVIIGTDRTSSIVQIENHRITGIFERRPNARRIPIGSAITIEKPEMIRVRKRPPQASTSTGSRVRFCSVKAIKTVAISQIVKGPKELLFVGKSAPLMVQGIVQVVCGAGKPR